MNCHDNSEGASLQYARLHLLACDHLAEPLPVDFIYKLQKEIDKTWIDDSYLPSIPRPPSFNINERLKVGKDAAILLAEATGSTRDLNFLESAIMSLLDIRSTKKIRLELPLLRTNHAVDFKAFAIPEQPCIDPGSLPSEPVDDEKNEGLKWPSTWISLPVEIEKEVHNEKFEVGRDTLFYLQGRLKDRWNSEDDREVWDSTTLYKKSKVLEPITPPLLPTSPPVDSYVPSSPACHLPLLSDPASLILDDLQAVEKIIFEQDAIAGTTPEDWWFSDSFAATTEKVVAGFAGCPPFLRLSDVELSQPIMGRLKTEDHKVEIPLLPATPASAHSENVKLNQNIEEMLLGSFFTTSQEALVTSQSDFDCFFTDACLNQIDLVKRQLEQEQLFEADSTQRVRVPVMDFTLPIPPWKLQGGSCNRSEMHSMQLELVLGVQRSCGFPPKLIGIRELVSRLKWSPFPPELAKVALIEEFGTDEDFRVYLTASKNQDVIDSSGLTWKPEGLRILKDEVDEDDLEPGHFMQKQQQDIASLVRKRKMHIDEITRSLADHIPTLKSKPRTGGVLLNCETEALTRDAMMNMNGTRKFQGSDGLLKNSVGCSGIPVLVESSEASPLVGIDLSVGDALDNYLEIRGSKKQKLVQSDFFAGTVLAKSGSGPPQRPAIGQTPTPSTAIPTPNVVPPLLPTSFIISSGLLKSRPIKHAIADLYPSAILFERDFRVHDTVGWLKPTSVIRSPISSPLADEADLILSPSTGLVITTLTKIKQKPLPGQKSKVAIRDHIEKVSERYERLIVLISEGTADGDSIALDSPSCLAIVEFSGFCRSLLTSTMVHFVAGGEHNLAKWVAATMAQFGAPESNVQLLLDETLWELFLRRAGMNAFAAQAVLAELKAPDGLNMAQRTRFGLTGFVHMEQDERLRRFGGLLGGTRVLERVGKVLDRTWS